MPMTDDAPAGFVEMPSTATGFVRLCGPFLLHAERPVVAVRIAPHHLNLIEIAHGGFLATLADSAFGWVIKRHGGLSPVTASLSVDYLGAVHEGDWVEAEVELLKVGKRLTNASCIVRVGQRAVLRASGVFVTSKP